MTNKKSVALGQLFHNQDLSSDFRPVVSFIRKRPRFLISGAFVVLLPVGVPGFAHTPGAVPVGPPTEVVELHTGKADTIPVDEYLGIDLISDGIELDALIAAESKPVIEIVGKQGADYKTDNRADDGNDRNQFQIVEYVREHGWLPVLKVSAVIAFCLLMNIIGVAFGTHLGGYLGEQSARKVTKARRIREIEESHRRDGFPIPDIIDMSYPKDCREELKSYFAALEKRQRAAGISAGS